MLLSRKFVSDYIDLPKDENIHDIAEKMTSIGNEYDYEGKLIPCSGLVIGKIIECEMHPDSTKLHICKVDVGNKVLQIVCGAPNARCGIKVIVAMDGATLPDKTIRKSLLAGYESNGMLCSLGELGLDHKYLKQSDLDGICELDNDAPIGEDPIKYLKLDDEVIDFELTSNRGDLLSILGMAYELGAIYNTKVKDIDLSYKENNNNIKDLLSLNVKTNECSLFLVKKAINVTIGESPDFIKNRLIASGIRPINNVVDISNYVMLETGQPLHFYDADKLGSSIGVRMANNDEEITTLDGEKRILNDNDLVIINDMNTPIGLAGVMGGLSTEVESDTKNIVIESAIFNPTLIRKTSKKILRSEASNRFEKGLDPNRTYMAIERSMHLLEKYAGATIIGGLLEYKNIDINDKEITITYDKINKVLGTDLDKDTILDTLDRLEFTYITNKEEVTIRVPSRRIDVNIEEDIIEEVGRIYGIDNIQGRNMNLSVRSGHVDKTNRSIRHLLCDLGLNETLTYTLIKEDDVYKYTTDSFDMVKILDPMTLDRCTLRYSLIPSLLSVYDYNIKRGITDINLFEIGKGFYNKNNIYGEEERLSILMSGNYYHTLGNIRKVDFYVIKGIVERLLNYLGYNGRYYFKVMDLPSELHPGVSASIYIDNKKIGIIGKIHPNVAKDNIFVSEINLSLLKSIRTSKMKYKEISKYPSISKDVAFLLRDDITSEEVIKAIKKAGGRLLTKIEVFDLYKGIGTPENMKSLAFKLYFEDPNKTLTLDEVMPIFEKIITEIEKKYNASVRSS